MRSTLTEPSSGTSWLSSSERRVLLVSILSSTGSSWQHNLPSDEQWSTSGQSQSEPESTFVALLLFAVGCCLARLLITSGCAGF